MNTGPDPIVRDTVATDQVPILEILRASGEFDAAGVAMVENRLRLHLAHPADEIWLTAARDLPVGVAYCAPEPASDRVWNLLMLWIDPGHHGAGLGQSLVGAVEDRVRAKAARILIVETSGMPAFEGARKLYARCGFAHQATLPDFYGEGDDKMVLTKRMDATPDPIRPRRLRSGG